MALWNVREAEELMVEELMVEESIKRGKVKVQELTTLPHAEDKDDRLMFTGGQTITTAPQVSICGADHILEISDDGDLIVRIDYNNRIVYKEDSTDDAYERAMRVVESSMNKDNKTDQNWLTNDVLKLMTEHYAQAGWAKLYAGDWNAVEGKFVNNTTTTDMSITFDEIESPEAAYDRAMRVVE